MIIMNEERCILIDSREPNDMVERISTLGVPIKIAKLDAGDYVISNILIERKTPDDFLNSINSGRLFQQLFNIKQSGYRGILCIIGQSPYSCRTQREIHAYRSKLKLFKTVAFLSYGILLEHVDTIEDFLEFIRYIWERSNGETIAPVVNKKITLEEVKIDILSRIPGIGAKMAKCLAAKFTIRDLMNMDSNEIESLKVGDRKLGKRGRRIVEVLNT